MKATKPIISWPGPTRITQVDLVKKPEDWSGAVTGDRPV